MLDVLAVATALALVVPAASVTVAKPVAAVLIVVAAARFLLTGIYELSAVGGWQTVSGVVGVILMVAAFYGRLALSFEDAQHRAVQPISRRGTSAAAFGGDFIGQFGGLPLVARNRRVSATNYSRSTLAVLLLLIRDS